MICSRLGMISLPLNSEKKKGMDLKVGHYPWGRSAYIRDPDGRLLELNDKGDQEIG